MALNVIISLIGFSDRNFFAKYMYNPYSIHRNKKEWYRIFTHAFLHADWAHLFFNMFTFYIFGLALEQELFPILFRSKAEFYYVLLYIGGIIVSSVPAFEKHKDDYSYSSIGASGAVSAVLFSYILIQPTASLGLLFIPIPIPAAIFGALYIVYSWYMSKRNVGHIAHDAHLYGSIFGFAFTLALKPALMGAFLMQLKNII